MSADAVQPAPKAKPGTVWLIPVPISSNPAARELAPLLLERIASLRHFVVEESRTAWRFLAGVLDRDALASIQLEELNEHTKEADVPGLLAPLMAGNDIGILSEAGSPCIADPGALLVREAHRRNIKVHAMPGPVSLMLALMASGFGGQTFAFHGYLPVDKAARRQALLRLERMANQDNQTGIFIETPYRNNSMIADALEILAGDTGFCVAAGLLDTCETVRSGTIRQWRNEAWRPGKIPAVFLIGAAKGAEPDTPAAKASSQREGRNPTRSQPRRARRDADSAKKRPHQNTSRTNKNSLD